MLGLLANDRGKPVQRLVLHSPVEYARMKKDLKDTSIEQPPIRVFRSWDAANLWALYLVSTLYLFENRSIRFPLHVGRETRMKR